MSKFKFLLSAAAIWGATLAIFILFSIYQDIKENKLFNYTDTYSVSEVEIKSEYQSDTTLKHVFKIVSHDDYLGSISFKYFRLRDHPGQVIFRIKEANRNNWYAQNRYDFSFFRDDDDYGFGFPQIADSKGKDFILEFEIISPNLAQMLNILDLKRAPILTTKYVFPRSAVYKSPQKLAAILLNRSISTIAKMDHLKIGIISLVIALFLSLIIYDQKNQVPSQRKVNNALLQKDMQVNSFFIPAGVLVFLITALVSNNFPLAERLANYLWVTLFASCVFYILQGLILQRLSKLNVLVRGVSTNLISVVDDFMTKRIFLIASGLLIIISAFSQTYYLGGDDSRLFYLYPWEYLTNYSAKIVSDTGVSQLTNWMPPASFSAFIVILAGLRTVLPFVNLQALLTSANLVGGFFAFYFLLIYLLRPENKYERVACILAAFGYVFSIFNFYTLLNSRLVTEYLISLFPLTLLLGIKAIRTGKHYLMVLAVLIWSASNLGSVSFPVSAAALLTIVPLVIFVVWNFKKRFIVYLCASGLIFVALNLHWLIFIPYTNLVRTLPGSNAPSIASEEFRQQNERGIRTVSEINNVFFPLLNSYHQKIQQNFHWPQLPIYNSWYKKFLPLGVVYIAVVSWTGVNIKKDRSRIPLFIASVSSFILAIYFFTVNIGPWGVNFFIWLTNHIPSFVIFRNMYDKFAYALAFQWAVVLAVGLTVVIKTVKQTRRKTYLLFLMLLIGVINAKPYIWGEFENLPYWTTTSSFDGIKALNKDYLQLTDFIKRQNTTGRYLSLPLLTGNSVIIDDQFQKNHYYAGVSPLLLLTGKNDLSGLISFSDKSEEVYKWIRDGEYEKFGQLLQQLNTEYIIVNNTIPSDLQNSFMFSDGLYALQTKKFFASVLGTKINEFGNRYSLYSISPQYGSSKIYLANDINAFANQRVELAFTKIASHEYRINISGLSHEQTLVFLDPYLSKWHLYMPSGKVVFGDRHFLVLGYANGWKLDPLEIKEKFDESDYRVNDQGQVGLDLRLHFQPHDYLLPSVLFSALSYAIAIAFVIRGYWQDRRVWQR